MFLADTMGAVVSSTNDGDYCGIVADLTHPSNEDWLRKHAVACNGELIRRTFHIYMYSQ